MTDKMFSLFDNFKPVTYVPGGTRITVYANADLWLRSDVEDENNEGYIGAKGLINERDPEMTGLREHMDNNPDNPGPVYSSDPANDTTGGGNANADANAQQQQLYYNNYQGQQMAQPRTSSGGGLVSKPKASQPAPAPAPIPTPKAEPAEEAPELF